MTNNRFYISVISLVLVGTLATNFYAQGAPPQVQTITPTGFVATAVSPTQINLSWSAPTQNFGKTIVGYKIERQISNGIYDTLVYNTHSTLTAYSVTGLKTGTTYTYRVSAVYSDDTSTSPSDPSSATPLSTSTLPTTSASSSSLTNMKLDFVPSDGTMLSSVIVSQGDYSALQYKKDPRSVLLNSASTTDPINNNLDSLLSYQNNHLADNAVPAPLIARPASATKIILSWLPPLEQYGQKLMGYRVELKNAPGDYSVIDVNTGNSTTRYSVGSLTPDTTYTYRVSAVYSGTHSNPSNEASVTTLEYVSQPVQKQNQTLPSTSIPSTNTPPSNVPPAVNNVRLDFTAPDGSILSGVILAQSDYQQLVIIKDPRSILSNVTQTSSTMNNVLSGLLRYQTLHTAKESDNMPPTPTVNSTLPSSSSSSSQPEKSQSIDSTLVNGVITSVVASGVVGITTWFVRTKVARKIAKEYHFTLEHVSSVTSSQIRIRNSGETIEDCVILCEKGACVWVDTNLDKPRHVYEGSVSSVTIPQEYQNQNPLITIKSGKKILRKTMLDDMAHG